MAEPPIKNGRSSEPLPRDAEFMRQALAAARSASSQGEVPVGAVIVESGQIIATSANLKEANNDPLGHAEIRVIRDAAERLQKWRLSGCTLYVTLEPCVMCCGAIVHSRIDRVVFGAHDPKAGAVESLYQILSDQRLNHRPEVVAGVLAQECSTILTDFFASKRRENGKKS